MMGKTVNCEDCVNIMYALLEYVEDGGPPDFWRAYGVNSHWKYC